MKMQKTGIKRRKAPLPQLVEEIIMEILLRLPVKSLLRFKSVCKAWRAMINDPMFIRDHLRHSASKWEQSQCFIISPHTLDRIIPDELVPTTFSNHFPFYQWQLQSNNNVATFLDSKDSPDRFKRLRFFSHYDGLVFAPTDSSLYLFNPATRDAITLPNSRRNNLQGGTACCYCAGFGLDPRTGKYKVVQAFYCSMDPDTGIGTDMGMEVFTVAGDDGGVWREITSNPPYPARRVQTAMAVGGFMFWRLAEPQTERALCGILHLSLEEEEFGITGLPNQLSPDDEFTLDVLHGRDLCVTSCDSDNILSIWILPVAEEGLNTLWQWQYSIPFSGRCHPRALPPFGNGVILWQGNHIYCYDPETSELRVLCELHCLRYQKRARRWENLFSYDVLPFTESLIRIT